MAEPGLIAAYLAELRASTSGFADVDTDDIVAEAEDHLLTAVEAAVRAGQAPADAEAAALARFGSAPLVARVFAEEAKRGGAVPVRSTRQAGIAAMLVPVLLVVGELGNRTVERGVVHGAALVLLAAGFAAFAFTLWGLRCRHGGLGVWGRASFWLFVASPVIAAPFGWAAGVAFLFVQMLVLTLLGVGMIRAGILPRPALALFTFTPAATLVAAALLSTGSLDTGPHLLPAGVALSAVGLAWVGLAMWREPALDARPHSDQGPFATA